jgi:predicted anti-sigma-YlaC factor YlaD
VRVNPILSEVCHRTRQQISLGLDSELSELEEALVAAHLERCATCRAFATEIEAFTETLRLAPPVELSMQIRLPRRRARIGVGYAGSAAVAAISVAIALVGVVGLPSSPNRIPASEIQNARDRMILKEQLMQAMEIARPAHRIQRGLEAARGAE